MTAVLEMRGIGKEYYGNRVLRGIDLEVGAGEVVCLVGENGAGKSTLMNILFGMPVILETGGFEGTVKIGGEDVRIQSPQQAMELGVGMVHQEFMLVPGFSVVENIKLNREVTRSNLISTILEGISSFGSRLRSLDEATMLADAQAALDRVGLDVDPLDLVGELPVGHKQFIEIAREVDRSRARLLVFDEPSAVLAETEADRLLTTMKQLAADGIGILFITHRLDEVLEIADRVVVLRDGEQVCTMQRQETDASKIAELMVGRKVEARSLPARKFPVQDEDRILTVRDLRVSMPGESVSGLDLNVRRGEILGVGGLAGYGKLGLSNGLAGLFAATGEVAKDGQPFPLHNPLEAMKRGMAFVSEDRRGVGLLLDESIELNMGLPWIHCQKRFLKSWIPGLGLLDGSSLSKHARQMIERFDIRCVGSEQPVRRLSGGNQQKVCIAKAITGDPDLLLVNEPTRGVDVGAKQRILDELVALNRKQRMTVVLTSSELAELRSVCDRVAIVSRGRVSKILAPDAPDVEFGLAMAG